MMPWQPPTPQDAAVSPQKGFDPMISIAVINASTVLSDDQVASAVPALQTQVSQHFAPAWGVDAQLSVVPAGQSPAPGAWWLVVLDNSDVAGALGYHDLTSEGLPLGKVFAGTDLQYGQQWTVTASHELLEMLADPDINLTAFVQSSAKQGTLYAYEVADPVEADALAYSIGGVPVSDFVFPAWFESFRTPGSTQFDFANQVAQPFQLAPGGYIGVFHVSRGGGWTLITADGQTLRHEQRPRVGSRRERRATPREHWQRSRPARG
jgi:hypothetical protein